jgi:hypothetical protein
MSTDLRRYAFYHRPGTRGNHHVNHHAGLVHRRKVQPAGKAGSETMKNRKDQTHYVLVAHGHESVVNLSAGLHVVHALVQWADLVELQVHRVKWLVRVQNHDVVDGLLGRDIYHPVVVVAYPGEAAEGLVVDHRCCPNVPSHEALMGLTKVKVPSGSPHLNACLWTRNGVRKIYKPTTQAHALYLEPLCHRFRRDPAFDDLGRLCVVGIGLRHHPSPELALVRVVLHGLDVSYA